MHDKEEPLLKKRILELAESCYRRDIRSNTGFLTLNEQTIFHSIKQTLPPVTAVLNGGYELAERKIVCFLPSYEDETAVLPICLLKAEPVNSKFSETLTHRDFLGSIMNLGIERSCIGDILVKENTGYLFCLDKMAEYLCEHFTAVRHTPFTCRMAEQMGEIAPSYEEISGSVASPRLDSVIALVFRTSRSKVLPYIEGEKVFINGKSVVSAGLQLKGGEIVSVRGLGKFCYTGTGNETKKGRIYVNVRRYS